MANYIDGFILPIPRRHMDEYRRAATSVAEIWKEHGALSYFEYIGDDFGLEGVRSFPEIIGTVDDEVIIFGWVAFDSREARDLANQRVVNDPRMAGLIDPLIQPSKLIFDTSRMVYGGFQPLVRTGSDNEG